MTRTDLTGQRFGRLTALYPVEKRDRGTATSACWRCRCDCGREADPAWAEANPFVYEVEQVDGGFAVHTNGSPEGVRSAKNILQSVSTETIAAAESVF